MKTDTFYFKSRSQFHNVARLITHPESDINYLTIEDGYSKMVDGENKEITIDFSGFNPDQPFNLKSIRDLALALLKAVDGDNFNVKNQDSLMSQIKVRVSSYKYLREYLSSVELCYVEFTDGTSCLIGDSVREEMVTTDTLYLDRHLFDVTDSICYSLQGQGIGTSISKYFLSKHQKEVKEAVIVNAVTLFEIFKDIFEK